MKNRFTYLLFTILFFSMGATAQCPSYKYQPEIIASYGVMTGDEVIDNFRASNSDQRTSTEITSGTGALFLTGRYFMYSCLSIGMTFGYMGQQGVTKQGYGSQLTTTGNFNKKAVSIAVEINYLYRITKYIDAYTFLGVGPTFTTLQSKSITSPISTASDTKTAKSDAFRMHYSPIGIRVGGRIGGFAELGFGYKGLLSGGLSVRLGRRWCSKR